MPSRTGVTQVRTFGTPSTIILQSLQRPMPQKIPRGWPVLTVRRITRMPLAIRAAATGSPVTAGILASLYQI